MSERVHIPLVEPEHRGSAGWYLEDGQPALICGGCGRHAGTMDNHSVSPDGEANDSIACPYPRCGWHVWGILDGWTHGTKAAGLAVSP